MKSNTVPPREAIPDRILHNLKRILWLVGVGRPALLFVLSFTP